MYNISVNNDTHISISTGNIKVGLIPQFNTLPGDEPIKVSTIGQLSNIKGTCGGLCECCVKNCYAVRSAMQHHNVIIPSWGKNTLVLREMPQRIKEDITAFLNKEYKKGRGQYFRFHTSGEFESVSQIALYADICNSLPNTNFYVYTKAFSLFLEYLRQGGTIPTNLVVNLSEWHGNIKAFYETENVEPHYREIFESMNVFSYDDHTPECLVNFEKMPHCPAVDKNGKETGIQCMNCKRCMKRGHRTAVYNH